METKTIIRATKPVIVQIGMNEINSDETITYRPSGSGFLVSSSGHILTCSHVIDKLSSIKVGFEVGTEHLRAYDAIVIYTDGRELNDFAILKIDVDDGFTLPAPIKLGDFETNDIGDETLFLGYPLKVKKITTHKAMISAKGINLISRGIDQRNPVKMFQVDGAVNRGNSGGPLINSDGHAIGIITLRYTEFDTLLAEILERGRMTGVSIGNDKGRLDIGDTFYSIIQLMQSHINVGIGHAFSIEYAKNKLIELKILEE